MQEALAAKEEEDKKRESQKLEVEAQAAVKPETRVTLRNYPSIVVQQRLTDEYSLQSVSLDVSDINILLFQHLHFLEIDLVHNYCILN